MTERITDNISLRRQPPAPRRARRESSSRQTSTARATRLVLVAVAVALVLAIAVDAFASAGRVHPGVNVAGVKVGGKMPSDAVSTLRAQLPAKARPRQ